MIDFYAHERRALGALAGSLTPEQIEWLLIEVWHQYVEYKLGLSTSVFGSNAKSFINSLGDRWPMRLMEGSTVFNERVEFLSG